MAIGVASAYCGVFAFLITSTLPTPLFWGMAICVGLLAFTSALRLGLGRVWLAEQVKAALALRGALWVSQWRVVKSLSQRDDRQWALVFEDGSMGDYRLLSSSVVTRGLVSLRFSPTNVRFAAPISVLITPDRVSDNDYRRLQVLLRWQGKEELGI
ncbi:hypothetical protein A9Q99_21780 [Gammaproteobacteria bacterium 45_16_T64]|nr:hypothetical protein A9Q99_21780 [Gammaproteobacteria bacterium 45_16_T64]